MFIINPLTGQGMDNMFSTHPNTENRIAELEAMAQEWGIDANANLNLPPARRRALVPRRRILGLLRRGTRSAPAGSLGLSEG